MVWTLWHQVVDGSADCASAAGSSGGGAEETELFQSATCDLVQLSPDGRRGSDSTTRDCAVAITEMASVQAFYVSGFQGNPAKDSACVWVSEEVGRGGGEVVGRGGGGRRGKEQ